MRSVLKADSKKKGIDNKLPHKQGTLAQKIIQISNEKRL